jgi:WD40 repeat protein
LQDTLHLATGCQDGLLRVYNVCKPTEAPLELKVSASAQEGVSKIAWSLVEPDVVFVGKKSGVVEKWDTRVNTTTAPVASVSISGGENIMDFEQSVAHNVLMVASGKKVSEGTP